MRLKLLSSLFVFLLLGLFLDISLDIPKSSVILDREGRVLSLDLAQDDKFRFWQALEEMNQDFVGDIIEKEDRFFYYHPGVNPFSFVRATLSYLSGTGNRGGASTITMQLARLYYRLNTRSPLGKMSQVFHALWLEMRMSKRSILESYLNLIPMGKNIEGYETAALYYFRKNGTRLTELERNFLSLLPQRPYLLAKLKDKDYSLFKSGMKILYPNLSFKDHIELLKTLNLNYHRPFEAPHFSYRLRQINNSLKIKSSLNRDWQLSLEQLLKRYLEKKGDKGIRNASLLVLDSDTGEILSYLGSGNFYDSEIHGQVDGIQAKRSPGSTLKPFIYAKAIELGLVHDQSILMDSPLPYRTPENYDRKYLGPLSVKEALISSRNIPAVYINNKLQARGQGLYALLDQVYPVSQGKGYYGSSIALGALELTPLQLGEFYMMLARNGEFKKARYLKGKNKGSVQLLSPESSVVVKNILAHNSRPDFNLSDSFAQNEGAVYWKTGTSFGFRDAWAVGIWRNYVVVSWVGDFKSRANPYLVGSMTAAPLFFQVVDFLRNSYKSLKGYDSGHLYHRNVTEVEVCAVSGHLPNKHCQGKVKANFIPGVSPIEKCEVHKEVELSASSHLRVCPSFEGERYKRVFEFFSNEKAQVYAQFGIDLTRPPGIDPQCKTEIVDQKIGVRPEIISPKIGYTYIVEQGEKAIIPLEARTDSASSKLSWYIGEVLQKQSDPRDKTVIELSAGNYLIKVVDELGRMSSRVIRVR